MKWLEVGMKVEMEHTNDKDKARKIAQDHLNEDPDYYKDWDNKEKILFQEKAPKVKKGSFMSLLDSYLEKGGEGSGKRGHTTANVVSLNDKLKGKKEKAITRLDQHLNELTSGAVVPNAKTQSGKPVFTNTEHATAHSYTPEDHKDAMNIHYDLAQKFTNKIDQLEQAGHKVPESAHKIKDFHNKKFKEHFRAGQKLSERMKQTDESVKQKKDSMNKSVTQMGHFEAGDLHTGDYATSYMNATENQSEWLLKLQNMMENFKYGDTPRELTLDKGVLSLVKVDDGQYTGYFRKNEDGLEDNAKIRIERINLPELVQLLLAKEFINPKISTKDHEDVANSAYESLQEFNNPDDYGRRYAAAMEMAGQAIEAQEAQNDDVGPGLTEEQNYKMNMLQLISKLLG